MWPNASLTLLNASPESSVILQGDMWQVKQTESSEMVHDYCCLEWFTNQEIQHSNTSLRLTEVTWVLFGTPSERDKHHRPNTAGALILTEKTSFPIHHLPSDRVGPLPRVSHSSRPRLLITFLAHHAGFSPCQASRVMLQGLVFCAKGHRLQRCFPASGPFTLSMFPSLWASVASNRPLQINSAG